MTKRKSISKKARFEIFKRDSFSCQYCGLAPPKTVLELDHIHPVSKGGDNDIDNLITACFDCNRGKSNNLLNILPETIEEKRKLLAEKEAQLKAYKTLKRTIKARKTRFVNKIESIFQETYPNSSFTESSTRSIKLQFIPKMEEEEIEEAIHTACGRIPDNPNSAYKYFCGICWNIIKGES